MDACSADRMSDSEARLLTGVLDIVVRRLPEHELDELARPDRRLELAPDPDDDVLGGRDHAAHERDVEVEVLVVDAIDGTLLGDPLQRGEVEDVAGAIVHGAAHRHVEDVVVAVPVRVVALPEQMFVLLVGERGIVHSVRRVEVQTASHGDDGHWRGGVGASVRRDTNAARRAAVPAAFARMTPNECGRRKIGPRSVPRGPRKSWNGEGFLKPSRNNEALTTPSVYPRTGGLTSV